MDAGWIRRRVLDPYVWRNGCSGSGAIGDGRCIPRNGGPASCAERT